MSGLLERRAGSLSPQQVDPLSWITGPYVPLVFGVINLAYGLTMAILTLPQVTHPFAQFAATALEAAACLFVHLATRPMRPLLGWGGSATALLIGMVGVVISGLGYHDADFQIEQWWAPLAFSFVLASLSPYLPARRILILGFASILVAAPICWLSVRKEVPFWGPVSIAVMIVVPMLLGTVGASIFAAIVVRRMLPMLERRSQVLVSLDAARSEQAEEAERRQVAEMSARVAPFLERIERTGRIDPMDRVLAGQIARQLRDDLVARANLSWLDSVAETDRVVVIDPEQRAGKMRPSQRTALRGLLRAILETPGADTGSVLVELRGQPDGSTAVAVSLDVDLPEGRRIMHLSPYYLTLRTAVKDLRWEDVRHLKFELPPEG
jgi:hypothetical protein